MRIGIHCGSVLGGRLDLTLGFECLGEAINIASRVESKGRSGQVAITQEIIDVLSRQKLVKDQDSISFVEKQELKGCHSRSIYYLSLNDLVPLVQKESKLAREDTADMVDFYYSQVRRASGVEGPRASL